LISNSFVSVFSKTGTLGVIILVREIILLSFISSNIPREAMESSSEHNYILEWYGDNVNAKFLLKQVSHSNFLFFNDHSVGAETEHVTSNVRSWSAEAMTFLGLNRR